jgi:hypothetical protein
MKKRKIAEKSGSRPKRGKGRAKPAREAKPDLSARKEAVALLLASGHTQKQAAAAAKVTDRAVRGWLEEDAFRARVAELQTRLFGEAVGRLASLATKAADALEKLLKSKNPLAVLSAAKTILEAGPKLRDAVALAREVEELRKKLGGSPDEHGDTQDAGEPAEAAGREAHGGAGPAAGAAAGGPGAADEPGGDEPRLMADGSPATLPFARPDAPPLFPASG